MMMEKEGTSSGEAGSEGSRLKVTIEKWSGVAAWKWEAAEDDICGMCRSAFEGTCPECALPGDECPVVWGACTHCFHMHCILKWLNTQQLCPLCRQEWQFKE